MNSIDDDARLIGIDEKVWREFRQMTENKEQDYLPGFLEAEAEARESSVDKEAVFRHRRAVALRWFGYYKNCKDVNKRKALIDQYNKLAKMRGLER